MVHYEKLNLKLLVTCTSTGQPCVGDVGFGDVRARGGLSRDAL